MTYHVVIAGKAAGPYTAQELAQMGIKAEALVWHQGLPNWVEASTVQEIMDAVKAAAPQCPPVPQQHAVPPVLPAQHPVQTVQEPIEPQYEPQMYTNECPPNNLVMAIIGCVLFFPLGIPAIIKAASVNRLWNEGQYDLAEAQSASAKKLGLIAIIIGAVFETIFLFGAML